MRTLIVGGTRIVGPAAAGALLGAGHEVAVAHSGAHESSALEASVEHLHGTREELLADGGAVDRWRPEALIDTFAGGASAAKSRALADCAARTGASVVAVSSVDVYHYLVEAGLGDGSGAAVLPAGTIPLREDDPLRPQPYPGAPEGHDNVAMEAELHGCARAAALRCGAIYGPFENARERSLVEPALSGERKLELPSGGMQLFHRVALERVARSILAAADPRAGRASGRATSWTPTTATTLVSRARSLSFWTSLGARRRRLCRRGPSVADEPSRPGERRAPADSARRSRRRTGPGRRARGDRGVAPKRRRGGRLSSCASPTRTARRRKRRHAGREPSPPRRPTSGLPGFERSMSATYVAASGSARPAPARARRRPRAGRW